MATVIELVVGVFPFVVAVFRDLVDEHVPPAPLGAVGELARAPRIR